MNRSSTIYRVCVNSADVKPVLAHLKSIEQRHKRESMAFGANLLRPMAATAGTVRPIDVSSLLLYCLFALTLDVRLKARSV